MIDPAVWLLDVDGVLNALALHPAQGHRRFTACGYTITYDPTIVDRIHRMQDSRTVEVRWLTTWEDDANEYLVQQFGWPALALAGQRPFPDRLRWWKSELAQAVYDAGHRVVWTDDDLDYSVRNGDASWVESADPARLLMVTPDPRTGLTHAELDRIEAFLGGNPA